MQPVKADAIIYWTSLQSDATSDGADAPQPDATSDGTAPQPKMQPVMRRCNQW